MERSWHPGWAGWFTWGGRRGRLSYLGASLLVGLAVVAVVTALAAFASLGAGLGPGLGPGRDAGPLAIAAIAGIALAVVAALVAAAVAIVCILAQRMRDIGMPVVPCLVAYAIASLAASAAVALQKSAETAALWNPDYPLWLNLLQLALTLFALSLVLVPGNAWLDEE